MQNEKMFISTGINIQPDKEFGIIFMFISGALLGLLNSVMQSINADWLNTLVCTITEAVEDPDQRGLMQRWQERTTYCGVLNERL